MLDAVVTTNAYIDSVAIDIGYAVQSGVVLEKDGNYWKELGTSDYKDSSLNTRSTSNIVAIGTSSETYWSSRSCSIGWIDSSKTTGEYKPNDASISDCAYSSPTGLYYSGSLGMHSLVDAFGESVGNHGRSSDENYVNNHKTKTICPSGMRLPTINETSSRTSGGIPAVHESYTWTATPYTSSGSGYYYSWTSGGISYKSSNYSSYIRCVR